MGQESLQIETLTIQDIESVKKLQPEGWPDILPSIQYYFKSSFCFPFKAIIHGDVAGIGTAIIHGRTAWVAHIIVHKDHRNNGIGTTVTKFLVDFIRKTPCETILLIATALGEPVYKKLGFETETEYLFFENGVFSLEDIAPQIRSFEPRYGQKILEMDYLAYGEKRKRLLEDHWTEAQLYIEKNVLLGFYIPTLGDGLIVAENPEVGEALMKRRFVTQKKFCLPIQNKNALSILDRSGFKEFRRAPRMVLGKKISWDGSKIYNRVGGNLG